MDYSILMFFGSILIAPFVLLVAAALFKLGRTYGYVPAGWRGVPAYALIACSGYALVYLAASVEATLTRPAALQKEYLGREYVGPADLRRLELWGFQDPASAWTYALPAETLAELKRRCTPGDPVVEAHRCYLYSAMDERWFAHVWLEGGRLYIIDGLH